MENKLKIIYLTKECKLKYIKIKDFKQYLKILILIILFLCIYFFLFPFYNSNKLVSSRFMNVQKNNNNHRKKEVNFIYFEALLPQVHYSNKKSHSLKEIFNSKRLYISEANLTQKYIRFIRKINKVEEKNHKNKYNKSEELINPNFFHRKKDQYDFKDFINLCVKNELITNTSEIKYNNKPLISIILPSYNRQETLMISIRSIQNQSLKNIEIIIVDDCSTDNSTDTFKYLIEKDPRIRIFTHLKNMGVWRSRLDGFLYSKGKYILHFDTGDLYEDNYVLKDLYNNLFNRINHLNLFNIIKNTINIFLVTF
jgi:hypothetical protein